MRALMGGPAGISLRLGTGARVSDSECAFHPIALSSAGEWSNPAPHLTDLRSPCGAVLWVDDPIGRHPGTGDTEVTRVVSSNQFTSSHMLPK